MTWKLSILPTKCISSHNVDKIHPDSQHWYVFLSNNSTKKLLPNHTTLPFPFPLKKTCRKFLTIGPPPLKTSAVRKKKHSMELTNLPCLVVKNMFPINLDQVMRNRDQKKEQKSLPGGPAQADPVIVSVKCVSGATWSSRCDAIACWMAGGVGVNEHTRPTVIDFYGGD